MNHLAHLLLAGPNEMHRLGGFLGDFIKGPLEQPFATDLEVGLKLHRRIDSFTDSHPVVRRAATRLGEDMRRYAGIALDLYFDHLLARHWTRFAGQPLGDFSRSALAELGHHRHLMPIRAQWLYHNLCRHGLDNCLRPEWSAQVLNRLAARLRRNNPLPLAGARLVQADALLVEDFLEFFPELRDFAAAELSRLQCHLAQTNSATIPAPATVEKTP